MSKYINQSSNIYQGKPLVNHGILEFKILDCFCISFDILLE